MVVLALAACASTPDLTPGASPEAKAAVVKERSQARWDALVAGDVDKAYGFLSPAAREVTTLAQYKEKTKTDHFRAATVETVTCDAEVCKVKLTLTYDHRLMKGVRTPIEESWVLDKGQFWYLYRG